MVRLLPRDTSDPNLSKFRGLYAITDAEEAQWRAKKQQLTNLGSLSMSLFDEEKSDAEFDQSFDQERPITPINEVVKAAPKTYASLSNLIYRRISPRSEWSHISEEDQSSLGAVIMGEVNGVWPLLRRQVSDPFLTQQQNKELQRRITVHCITVCEQLFMHYAEKVKTLNSRGIFSNPANMSRIRAQLALDAGKYLDILSVRRHIISDLKKPPAKARITFSREEVAGATSSPSPTPSMKLSFHKLVKSSRPKRRVKYRFNLAAEVQSMQSLMPTLSMGKVHQLKSYVDRSRALYQDEEERVENIVEEARDDEDDKEHGFLPNEMDEDYISVSTTPRPPKHRWPSEPMPAVKSLLEELRQRQKEDEEFLRSPSLNPESRLGVPTIGTPFSRPELREKANSTLGLSRVPPPDVAKLETNDPREDLKMLLAKQEKDREKEKEERLMEHEEESLHGLPPLIQAITRREAQNESLRRLKQKQKDLDAKYEEEMREKRKPLPAPQYPQPPIIQSKLPGASNPVNKSPITIRASDVKINDRVDLSAVTLQSYLPVYNDLTGDISQATVKELDANLFQGGELREVYSEIMKTVPNLHQQYDNDPLIVIPGSNVDLSKILASSTLIRPRSQQVINPRLRKDDHDMPWEGQQIAWTKATRQCHSGYPASEVTTLSQGQGEGYSAFHRFTPSQLNHPGVEKGSRAYASWLQWWKNSINSDDFFKYLSTQDTDFLSVIFHFYDSDGAASEIESMGTAKLEAQREREQKLAALKKEKEEFVPGLWNVQSVTLGGLGKDPDIEEDDEFSEFRTPQSTARSQSFSQTGSRGFEGTPQTSFSRKETGRLLSLLEAVPSRKGSLGETDSTANFSFSEMKFGFDSSATASLAPLFGAASFHGSSPIGVISDEAFADEQIVQAVSDVPSCRSITSTQPCKIRTQKLVRCKREDSGNFGSTKSSLKTDLLKIHNRLFSTVKYRQKALSSSTRHGSYSNSSCSASVANLSLDKNHTCFSKSTENLKMLSATEAASTSGYFSVSCKQATKENESEFNGMSHNTRSSRESVEAAEESAVFRTGNLASSSKEGLNEGHITLSVKFDGGVLSAGPWQLVEARRKERERIFRTETVNTADFLTYLDPCAHIAKTITNSIRSGSMNRTTALSSKSHADSSAKETTKQDSPRRATVQERLEVVWHKLRMPDSQKLDCALKYSTDKYIKRLPDIVSSWERVTNFILQREKMMISLEIFEKEASDPNRFFERGHRGSSSTRLSEAKTRAGFYKKLESIETTLKASLLSIRSMFSDTVTFNGRPYLDKMEWDKVEMLYYLQQERRCIMLKKQGHSEPLDLFLTHGQIRLPTILPPTRYTQLPVNSVNLSVPE